MSFFRLFSSGLLHHLDREFLGHPPLALDQFSSAFLISGLFFFWVILRFCPYSFLIIHCFFLCFSIVAYWFQKGRKLVVELIAMVFIMLCAVLQGIFYTSIFANPEIPLIVVILGYMALTTSQITSCKFNLFVPLFCFNVGSFSVLIVAANTFRGDLPLQTMSVTAILGFIIALAVQLDHSFVELIPYVNRMETVVEFLQRVTGLVGSHYVDDLILRVPSVHDNPQFPCYLGPIIKLMVDEAKVAGIEEIEMFHEYLVRLADNIEDIRHERPNASDALVPSRLVIVLNVPVLVLKLNYIPFDGVPAQQGYCIGRAFFQVCSKIAAKLHLSVILVHGPFAVFCASPTFWQRECRNSKIAVTVYRGFRNEGRARRYVRHMLDLVTMAESILEFLCLVSGTSYALTAGMSIGTLYLSCLQSFLYENDGSSFSIANRCVLGPGLDYAEEAVMVAVPGETEAQFVVHESVVPFCKWECKHLKHWFYTVPHIFDQDGKHFSELGCQAHHHHFAMGTAMRNLLGADPEVLFMLPSTVKSNWDDLRKHLSHFERQPLQQSVLLMDLLFVVVLGLSIIDTFLPVSSFMSLFVVLVSILIVFLSSFFDLLFDTSPKLLCLDPAFFAFVCTAPLALLFDSVELHWSRIFLIWMLYFPLVSGLGIRLYSYLVQILPFVQFGMFSYCLLLIFLEDFIVHDAPFIVFSFFTISFLAAECFFGKTAPHYERITVAKQSQANYLLSLSRSMPTVAISSLFTLGRVCTSSRLGICGLIEFDFNDLNPVSAGFQLFATGILGNLLDMMLADEKAFGRFELPGQFLSFFAEIDCDPSIARVNDPMLDRLGQATSAYRRVVMSAYFIQSITVACAFISNLSSSFLPPILSRGVLSLGPFLTGFIINTYTIHGPIVEDTFAQFNFVSFSSNNPVILNMPFWKHYCRLFEEIVEILSSLEGDRWRRGIEIIESFGLDPFVFVPDLVESCNSHRPTKLVCINEFPLEGYVMVRVESSFASDKSFCDWASCTLRDGSRFVKATVEAIGVEDFRVTSAQNQPQRS